MSINRKIFLIFAISVFAVLIPGVFISFYNLHENLLTIEEENGQRSITRIRTTINEAVNNIDIITKDWAYWDDAYVFMETQSTSYIKSNLPPDINDSLQLDLILFISTDNQITKLAAHNLEVNQKESLTNRFVAMSTRKALLNRKGIIPMTDAPFLFSARPILTSEQGGPGHGILVMGKYLDKEASKDLSELIDLSLELIPNSSDGVDHVQANRDILLQGDSWFYPESDSKMTGYAVLKDTYDAPSYLIKTELSRAAYQSGKRTLIVSAVLSITSTAIFLWLTLWMLKYWVINRLIKLERELEEVRNASNMRVSISANNDEISSLSGAINTLLEKQEENLASVDKAKIEAEKALKQRTKMERHVIQSEKMEALGTLVGGMAHSLNNYLTPIITLCRMAREELSEKSDARDDLERVVTSAENAAEVVKSALRFARQEQIEFQHCNATEVIKQLLPLIKTMLPGNAELQFNISTSNRQVPISASNMQNIVMNSISNAVDSIITVEKACRISVIYDEIVEKLRETDKIPVPYARITIMDTGTGVDTSIKHKIFDPFFTTKQVGKGTGLGLSINHGIVTSAGGDIWFEDIKPNGTAFHIDLPLIEELICK